MGYCSALRKKLTTDTRGNTEELKSITLSRRSQTQKSACSTTPFTRSAAEGNLRMVSASVSVEIGWEGACGNVPGVMVMLYIWTGVWVRQGVCICQNSVYRYDMCVF